MSASTRRPSSTATCSRPRSTRLWHANAGARRNLNRGIKAPMSGHPKYNIHANDIDFQIESDFIGLMTPGLPRESNKYADRVGRVMNYGDGLYGGLLFGAMYSAAFFENDPHEVVKQGAAVDPARQRLRAGDRRRARLARAVPERLEEDLGAARGEVEQGRRVPGRRGRAVQHRREAERRVRRARAAVRRRRHGQDDGGGDTGRAGLRLQSLERGRRPRRDPRLREDPRRLQGRHRRAREREVRVHAVLLQRHRGLDRQARREGDLRRRRAGGRERGDHPGAGATGTAARAVGLRRAGGAARARRARVVVEGRMARRRRRRTTGRSGRRSRRAPRATRPR